MRPRTELLVAAGTVAALLAVAFAAGRDRRGVDDPDPRASSFVAGRDGVRALADAAERWGVEVVRWRERPQGLGRTLQGHRRATVAVLAPARAISPAERRALVRLAVDPAGADLVLAGQGAGTVMRCFGYRVRRSVFDSSRVVVGEPATGRGPVWTHGDLVPFRGDTSAPSRARREEEGACPPVVVLATDTLLGTEDGRAAMMRLTVAPHGRTVLLLGDAALLRNRALRGGDVAPIVAEAVLPREGRLIFDEFHQGYGPGGSMARAALDWSRRNPLGWMAWQLAVVGLIALVAGGVRFGPVRASVPRRRRSSLEHVRALATALAAARGHREAVGAMVRGLRRRLAPPSAPGAVRDDWRAWLASLAAHAPNANARADAERLARLADAPESPTAVLSAAHAVEDLWHSLRP